MEATRAPWASAAPPPAAVTAAQPAADLAAHATATSHAAQPVIPFASSSAALSTSMVPSSSSSFRTPSKQISSPAHLSAWKQSCAYAEIVSFILHLNAAVQGRPSSSPHERSAAVEAVVSLMRRAEQWIAEIPPIQQAMRFGNRAFRHWHQRLMQELPGFLSSLLSPELLAAGAAAELSVYLDEAFGNQQRIDYGTGHELNFLLFLLCAFKLQVFAHSDSAALVMDAFTAYIQLMENIQLTYWLEPAGSKGSWGLDDFQFLPFLLGSAQLIDHPELSPSAVLTPAAVNQQADDFLYFRAIAFVLRYKSGPFHEHSAMLHSVASLPSWARANAGLLRMYEEEVMNKFPIVQHIKFGSLLTMERYVDGKTQLAVSGLQGQAGQQAASRAGKGKAAPPAVPRFDDAAA